MRISIITPSFNQGEFIEDTIRSVMEQDHPDVEHIIIDGGSTDSTVAILKKYPHVLWVSEKDSGQASAINKGFRRATGEIVAWLNSDDYYEKNILAKIERRFREDPDCKFVYGDITFVDKQKRPLYAFTGDTLSYGSLIVNPDIVRQPSSFWRRDVVERLGGVNEKLHLVMDLDFFLRIGKTHSFHYEPGNLSYYRHYEGTKSMSQARRQVGEMISVFRAQRIGFSPQLLKFLLAKYLYTFGFVKALAPLIRFSKRLGQGTRA